VSELCQHFDPNIKRYWFRNVAGSQVSEEMRRLAADVFEFVVKDLDLSDLGASLTWIRPERWQVARQEHFNAVGRLAAGQGFQCECSCEPEDVVSGYVPRESTREIRIRSDLSDAALKKVIAHELRHLYQKKICGVSCLDGQGDCETDAYSYCHDIIAKFEEVRRHSSCEAW
jgi:hypothetical protein